MITSDGKAMSTTPRTDEAARQGCYLTTGDYASTCGKQIIHIDFARQLETELNEAKEQVAFLNRQVHIHDEMMAGLEEAQTISDAKSETIEVMSRLSVPISDVKPLLEALAYYTHQPYSAAARAVDGFFAKHPDLKP